MSCEHQRVGSSTARVGAGNGDRHLSRPTKTHPQVSGAREVFAVLVKGDRHDPVRGVEGLLHPVTVVDVNVDV